MVLTDEQHRRYVVLKGIRCPYCDSKELITGEFHADGENAWQAVVCEGCKKEWTDNYSLTDITEDDDE